MAYLLDTHCFLWAIKEPHRLSKRAEKLLADTSHERFLSAASMWEIAIRARIGKFNWAIDAEFVSRHMEALLLQPLAIQVAHVDKVFQLPHHHRDPFDRILVAQAQVEGLTIVTADPLIGGYAVKVIW